MRSVLGLDINLGMFGFPVKVYLSNDDPAEGIGFRQVHGACKHAIHQVKRCAHCNADVAYGDLVKGYEVSPDTFVTFTEEEIKALKPESAGTLKIDGYVAAGEIDPAYFDGKSWFLAPDGKDFTTFETFRDALAGRWAIGKVVMYQKEHVVAIRTVDRLLQLHWMRTHAEFRSPSDVPGYAKVKETASPEYVAMMSQLIDAQRVDLSDVVLENDAYVQALKALIDSRVAGTALPVSAVATTPKASAVDLMAMMKASLEAAKSKGGAA
jgi:DNA end-binding protein Ku